MQLSFYITAWIDRRYLLATRLTCRWMKTTDPRSLQVPPWRSTWSIRRIWRNLIPLMAEVANTWPLEPTERTTIDADTTIKSERWWRHELVLQLNEVNQMGSGSCLAITGKFRCLIVMGEFWPLLVEKNMPMSKDKAFLLPLLLGCWSLSLHNLNFHHNSPQNATLMRVCLIYV